MNIEIANRLINLRKEKGYTQESLADALGISRQAVSKWERAEASPDTDNLILLAKLYGVSLDELLKTDESFENIKSDNEEHNENSNHDKVYISNGKIFVKDKDGSEIHIDSSGIHMKDEDGEELNIGKNFKIKNKKVRLIRDIVFGASSLLAVITYILLGFLANQWDKAWVLFLLPPVFSSIVEMIYYKKITRFCYPVLMTFIYLLIGMYSNIWHPSWITFVTIPVFYMVFDPVDKIIHRNDNEVIFEEDDD